MTKETFSRLASMIGATSSINGVVTEIETAFDNTLSRDGSSPNQMNATLDMNSNRIVNLPSPLSSTEPVRLIDLLDNSNVSVITQYYVATRADLAALDTTLFRLASVVEDGSASGDFLFQTSNHAADVSADTQKAIYVAPSTDTTGASGAWVRVDYLTTGEANFLWWKPVLDGVTDNLTLAQAAYNLLSDKETLIVTGEGTLSLSSNVTLSGTKRLNYIFKEPLAFATTTTATQFRGGESAQNITYYWRNTFGKTSYTNTNDGLQLYDVIYQPSSSPAGFAKDTVRVNFINYDPSQGNTINGVAPDIVRYATGFAAYGQIGTGNYFGKATAGLSWIKSAADGGGTITAHEFDTFNQSDMRRTVTNVARTSNVVTITTATDHHLGVGQYVRVAVDTTTNLNGWYAVTAVPSSTTFTYTLAGTDIASTADTGEIEQRAINVSGGANKTGIRVVLENDYPISAALNIDTAAGKVGAFKGLYMASDVIDTTYSGEDTYKRYIEIGPGVLELDVAGKMMLGKTGSSSFVEGVELWPTGIGYFSENTGAAQVSVLRNATLGGAEALLGKFSSYGINSAGNSIQFSLIEMRSAGGVSGNEAGKVLFRNYVAGSLTNVGYVQAGLVLGAPSGGDLGLGTINAAGNITAPNATLSSLTGYVKGNGASVLTASATIPSADFADGNTGTGAVAHADSPAFTGSPTAPTQSSGDNSTKIATTAYVDALAVPATYAKKTVVQVFTSNGTYTPTSGMKIATVYAFGAGGGGGSGARAAAGAATGGGSGGGGGGLAQAWLTAAQIGASQTVTIGAAGTGGAAQTADTTAGIDGTAGGSTSLGTLVFAGGGGGGQGGGLAANSGGGAGGTTGITGGSGSGGTGGINGTGVASGGSGAAGGTSLGIVGSGSGGAGTLAAGTVGLAGGYTNALFGGGPGGGSGGGITTGNVASNGGTGGLLYIGGVVSRGAAGTVGAGQAGGNGSTFANSGGPINQAGAGGGGGASNTGAAAGAGGTGGLGGGGGAGGGASRNGFASGAGGNGGAGLIIIVEQF